MKLSLKKKPKNPILIEGFPGFGLIGTIATEYLIEHLDCELIGRYWFEDLPATIAIHEGKMVNPVGIFYNKKNNIVIIHSIAGATGVEWKAADFVFDIAKTLDVKEIISLEGVGSTTLNEDTNVFYHINKEQKRNKIEKMEIKPLKEGIIMGITSALMVIIREKIPMTCFFAETHTSLPDSKAAAKVIEVLDKYLGLNVDYKPLLKQAEKFEDKLRKLMEQGATAKKQQDRKSLSYVG
ncbi:proteasome assembly chaperone family protein [Candidatus Woesearchaeota archaeon]|nr:proteasome assembly chaperone family protein [Candidatus Woesearchaeota archaeon]